MFAQVAFAYIYKVFFIRFGKCIQAKKVSQNFTMSNFPSFFSVNEISFHFWGLDRIILRIINIQQFPFSPQKRV